MQVGAKWVQKLSDSNMRGEVFNIPFIEEMVFLFVFVNFTSLNALHYGGFLTACLLDDVKHNVASCLTIFLISHNTVCLQPYEDY